MNIDRIYWDGEETRCVEAPLGDFLCNSWKCRQEILAVPGARLRGSLPFLADQRGAFR